LHIITNLELGGAQKYALTMINGVDKDKYTKYFISAPRGLLCKQAKQIGNVKVYFLSALKQRIHPIYDLMALIELVCYIKEKKIDLVHTHSSKAGIIGRWAAKIAGVKVILHTIHGWSFNHSMNPFVYLVYVWLEKITALITTKFVAVCQSDIDKGIGCGIGLKDDYTLLQYGLDLEKYANGILSKEKFGFKEQTAVVGIVACFKPQKNLLDFIEAAAIISKSNPNVKFVCVGDGVMRTRIEKLVKDRQLDQKIIFLGWRQDVIKIMSIFDIVALTSLWEGLPIALLEAAALGKSIVAYDVDGVKEIVQNGQNGYLISVGDISAFADKVNILLKDPQLCKIMGANGKDLLQHSAFQIKRMLSRTDELYSHLLK